MNVTRAELDALLRRRGQPQGHQSAAPGEPNKYGAQRTEYDGRTYDSKAEAEYAMRLDLRKRAGEIRDWRPQVVLLVEVDASNRMYWRLSGDGVEGEPRLVMRCRIDFQVCHCDGSIEYHEVKGFRVRDWVLRERILRLAGVPLVVVGRKS